MSKVLDRVGKDLSSSDRWNELANDYPNKLQSSYHLRRLEVIKSLISDVENKNIIDFGCGEGVMVSHLSKFPIKQINAIDPNELLLEICKKNNPNSNCINGGVDKLKNFDDDSVDLIIAANVIGYLTDEEENLFYNEAKRIIKTNGEIIISFSNELFDLFTFNKYTVDFYNRYFETDISALIKNPTEPNRNAVNIRENPINYPNKAKNYKFSVKKIEYINFHEKPPLISGDDPDDLNSPRIDTLNFKDEDKWKLMFQCSTFAAKLIKE